MQFRDLKAQYAALKPEMDDAIFNVIENTAFISGKAVGELEKKLAEYVGVKHCITCANGTDALTLALKAWGIGKGDAVFVPDFTFFSSGEVVPLEGATPVFVDVSKDTFNISPDSLELAIKAVLKEGMLTPKVIVAVDLFGLPADFQRIREIADKYNMYILEDAAQGFGGNISGKKACSFGDISTTSFFPAKPLGCYGDGGAVFTNDDEWANLITSYHIHGKGTFKYDNIRIGLNSRLDTIQAAVLLVKLPKFADFELSSINEIAGNYTKELKEIVVTPSIPENYYSSWAQYTILLKNGEERARLQEHLKEKGIPSMVYYPKAMHRQQAFENYNLYDLDFANTEDLCSRVLSLPLHPYMTKQDQETVISEIITCLKDE